MIKRLLHRGLPDPRIVLSLLPEAQRQAFKTHVRKLRAKTFSTVFSYGSKELKEALRKLGIKEGDAILMQSSFNELNGFKGEAFDVIDSVLDVIGPEGHLFMVSMPYGGAASEYLLGGNVFDVKRTPSHMGLLSEMFRRRKGVIRSASPIHPILAWGPRSEWLVAGHEDLLYSCGENSPFERMLELDTKGLVFDVELDVLTFAHYLEHIFREASPVPVYTAEPIGMEIIDQAKMRRAVAVYAFSPEVVKLRNFSVLYDDLIDRGKVTEERVGNTRLQLVSLRNILSSAQDLMDHGIHIIGRPGEVTRTRPHRRGRLRRLIHRFRRAKGG
jgi:aminoglycoside 3-N-acetyltransferase